MKFVKASGAFEQASGEGQRVTGVEFEKTSGECRIRKDGWRV